MIESNPCSELSPSQPIYPTQADTTELFTKDIAVAGVGTYPIVLNAPYFGRISVFSIKASAGTGTFTVKIGNVTVTGLVGKVVSTTEANYVPTDLNSFKVDDDITIEVISATDLVNISVTISVLRETGTASVVSSTVPGGGMSTAVYERVSAAYPAGFILVDIPFSATKVDQNGNPTTDYDVNAIISENFVDAVPDRIFPTLVGKTSTGITLLLSAVPTTSNTIFRAVIATAGAATNVISGGAGGGGGGSGTIATTSLILRGDGGGDAIPITTQSGEVATALSTLNIVSSGTYDATKLSGNIPVTRFNSGINANQNTVLSGDGTWKSAPGGGSVATDPLFTVKGDLAVASGNGVSARLPVGQATYVLIADSNTPLGLRYGLISATNIDTQYQNGLPSIPSLRTLGTGAQTAAAGDDSRITGALQAANNLSEFAATFDQVRQNLNFGDIVYSNLPEGGQLVEASLGQTLTNKGINALDNTITNLSSANFSGAVIDLTDPGADRILYWNNTTKAWEWLASGAGITISGASPSKQVNFNSQINQQIVDYTLVLSDAEKTIYHPVGDDNARTFTIPSNASVAYPIGTKINFINDKNTLTIAITSDTMVLSGGTSTGSRTLATSGNATAQKLTSTRWIIWGNNLT